MHGLRVQEVRSCEVLGDARRAAWAQGSGGLEL